MAQDTVDASIYCKAVNNNNHLKQQKVPSLEALNSEISGYSKLKGKKVFRCLINRLRLRKSASADISKPDPTYKVAYLGNVITGWAKGKTDSFISIEHVFID